jgi:uncharacterized protein (DUF983 family)
MKLIQCLKCRKFGTFVNDEWAATCDNCGSQRKIVYGPKQITFAIVMVIVIFIAAAVVQLQKPPAERNWGPFKQFIE